jgi:hypothetical protein
MKRYLSTMRSWILAGLHDERGTVASNYMGLISVALAAIAVTLTLFGDQISSWVGTLMCSISPGGC